MQTVAVFGGSFNPPHIGHTLALTYVLSQYVNSALVVPTYKHVFRKELAPFKHRENMAKLAMGWLPNVKISYIEEKIRSSRMIDVIEALYDTDHDKEYRLVIGSDILSEKEKWHQFADIEMLAPPIVLSRGGFETAGVTSHVRLPVVSSSAIREKLKTGDDVSSVLSPRVVRYIKAHKLYR